jgi:hypothetical protein
VRTTTTVERKENHSKTLPLPVFAAPRISLPAIA